MKQIFLFALVLTFASCTSKKITEKDKELLTLAQENFKPLPTSIIDVEQKRDLIILGQKLYFEKKLSVNNSMSCNTCHNLETFGVDNEPTSPGHEKKRGDRNSPTVLNAALHASQFWDGREPDVEAQALGPILNPVEMGMPSEKAVMDKLREDQEYVELFAKAFPGTSKSMKYVNVGKAIGAFERTLLTPSRFDDYLKGDVHALSEKERRGLNQFVQVGCTSCHAGVVLGGDSFQKIGAINEYKTQDKGRYNVTKDKDDMFFFKVPSLRNVVHTGPYFHDGSIKTLDEAIRLMGHHQLDVKLSEEQLEEIKAFLASTTGKGL